jgi:O-methyltransferase
MSSRPAYLIGNTLVDQPRLDVIANLMLETNCLGGIVAEVGVYRGGTARWICEHTVDKVLLFDTFEGMPAVSKFDLHHQGDFADTSLEHVDSLLEGHGNYALYKGVFPCENSQYANHHTFRLVHLDVDIYKSVKECLEYFETRMVPGGIIILDDYNEPNCPGAKLAADDFCLLRGLKIEATVQSQVIVRF